MNLSEMMSEPTNSVIDHSWWTEGLKVQGKPTFDPVAEGIKKRNNIKPALAIEFGNAGPEINPNEPAGIVQRNLENAEADVEGVIVFARDQMNRGKMGKSLVSALKGKFASQTLCAAKDGLMKQLALAGIVGCIAVDGRGYKSCKEAMKSASHSPYAKFIKHVIGCGCGDCVEVPVNEGRFLTEQDLAQAAGNPIDQFMASEKQAAMKTVGHCRSTMLPILSAQGDFDQSEMDQTLIDLGNLSGLPQTIAAKIKSGKFSSRLAAVKSAFLWLDAQKSKANEDKYAEKVDSAQFIIDNPGQEVEVKEPVKAAELKMADDFGMSLGQVPLEPEMEMAEGLGMLDMTPVPEDIEFTDEMDSQSPVLSVVPEEILVSAPPLGSLDNVEMDQFQEEEFVGTDVVDILEPVAAPEILDVSMGANEEPDIEFFASEK